MTQTDNHSVHLLKGTLQLRHQFHDLVVLLSSTIAAFISWYLHDSTKKQAYAYSNLILNFLCEGFIFIFIYLCSELSLKILIHATI